MEHYTQSAMDMSALEQLRAQSTLLPRLPVPALEQTLQRFLRSCRPLVTDQEYQEAEKLAQELAAPGGLGETLQKALLQRAASTENWLASWWLETAYLSQRLPLPVYSSTCFLNPIRPCESREQQVQHAAALVVATLQFKERIYSNDNPVDRASSVPLDMSQYFLVFGSCKVPGHDKDSIFHTDIAHPPKHIIVAHNNHFFSVSVYDEVGVRLNHEQVCEQLRQVMAQSEQRASLPIGLLTAAPREDWAAVYPLLRDLGPNNARWLRQVESSLYLLCLDQPSPRPQGPDDHLTRASLQMLHGGGAAANSANRWFDKTIQLVVGAEGEMGFTYEHTPAEGQPVALIMDYVEISWAKRGATDRAPPAGKFAPPEKLEFVLGPDVKDAIRASSTTMDRLVREADLHHMYYETYGREFIKSQAIPPDSYIQMAIQLAFFRLHGEPSAQYESASTRRFLHGRTETIRSCTPEAVVFVRAMADPAVSVKERAQALVAAAASHREYTMQAVAGQGVDRHLLGLRRMAAELGMPQPGLLASAAFAKSANMRLSTSQVAVTSPLCRGYFCPLVPDGYGVVYNPLPNTIMVCITAFTQDPRSRTASEFGSALSAALEEMRHTLQLAQLNHKGPEVILETRNHKN